MLPTGSKLLIGAAALATVAAIVYGITQGGSLGTVGLIFAAAALAGLAGINIYVRDSDVSAMDPTALTESAGPRPPPRPGAPPPAPARQHVADRRRRRCRARRGRSRDLPAGVHLRHHRP